MQQQLRKSRFYSETEIHSSQNYLLRNIMMSDKFSIELFQKVLRSYLLKWGGPVPVLIVLAFIFRYENALSSRIIAIGDIISVVFLSIDNVSLKKVYSFPCLGKS